MTRGVARDFLALFEVADNGCWNFTGPIRKKSGYGAAGRHGYAHRYFYRELVGPIPEGLHIDHLCMNKQCVNPKHLEPVTPGENARRYRAATEPSVDESRARALAMLASP